MEVGKGVLPAFTAENITRALNGVKWTTKLANHSFRIPLSNLVDFELRWSSTEDRLRAASAYLVSIHPAPSWRWLIWGLEYAQEFEIAVLLYDYAEPLTDPTFTVMNVLNVLETVETLDDLQHVIGLPHFKRNEIRLEHSTNLQLQKEASLKYMMDRCHSVTWSTLAGRLFSFKEDKAVQAAKRYLPMSTHDPSLTVDNLCEVLEEVEHWENVANAINIPGSQQLEIKPLHSYNPSQYKRAAWTYWLAIHPDPSWALIADGLFFTWEHKVLKQVQRKYPAGYSHSREIFNEACKRGKVIYEPIKVLLSGVAGSGKTSTLALILEKDPPTVRRSTPCACRPVNIVQAITEDEKWEMLTDDGFKHVIADFAKADALPRLRELLLFKQRSIGHLATINAELIPPTSTKDSSPHNHGHVSNTDTGSDSSQPEQPQPITSKSTVPKSEPVFTAASIEEELVRLINQTTGSGILFKRKLISLSDSGGQPQFQEVLPVFLRRTSACIFVQDLSQCLSDKPPFSYFDENGEPLSEPIQSLHTNEEHLRYTVQSMRSYQCGSGQCPKIMVIGTHRDEEHNSTETRAQKEVKLRELFLPTFKDNIIFNCNDTIFPLNAKFPESVDREVAAEIRKAITELCCGEGREMEIPLRWFALQLKLQEIARSLGRKVVSKAECMKAASHLHFDEDSFNEALEYLDELNIIFHFSSTLPDIIFCDVQVLLDKITELVEHVYKLFQKSDRVCARSGEWFKFRDFGIINEKFLASFKSHYIPGLFTAKELLKLFRALLIVANLRENEFFMPCLLRNANVKIVDCHRKLAVPPLIFEFPDGLLSGVFCSTISYLLSPENIHPGQWRLPLNRDGSPKCLYRNCVKFVIPSVRGVTITLIDTFEFIEVHINCLLAFCSEICPVIRDAILSALSKAVHTLHYKDCKVELAMLCSCAQSRYSPHPAIVSTVTGSQTWIWVCTLCEEVYGELRDELFKLWLKTVGPNATKVSLNLSSDDSEHQEENLDLSNLTILRWKDAEGKIRKLRIISRICNQWRTMGDILNIENSKLMSWAHNDRDFEACCRNVLNHWLENGGTRNYPTTWDGLCELLEDVDCGDVAVQLKRAIANPS